MKEFLKALKKDKIAMNWNKNPITMELFLSFLTVPTKKLSKFLGSDTGWTKYVGENGLDITGGVVGGIEYLDHILFGKNLDNQYNNFVNPFYLFDILTEEGKGFFLQYYAEEIRDILRTTDSQAKIAKTVMGKTFKFWEGCGFDTNNI